VEEFVVTEAIPGFVVIIVEVGIDVAVGEGGIGVWVTGTVGAVVGWEVGAM
jgi:hypothetical protein